MNLKFSTIITLSFFWAFQVLAATDIQINSPQDGWDLRKQTVLNVSYTVNALDVTDAKIVVFRMNNHAWPRMQEVAMYPVNGTHIQNVIPAKYYCEDLYAIRIMSGEKTLAGPVHFQAGVGACSDPDRNKFVNLEASLLDLQNYKPTDQADRDSCSSFAAAAALSAAYQREKGIKLLFSPQFLHHLAKSTSYSDVPFYLYENQSSLWGGNNLTTAFKIITYYATPSEAFAPYMTNAQLFDLSTRLGLLKMNWNANPQINRVSQKSVDVLEYNEQHIPMYARQAAMYGATKTTMVRKELATNTDTIENWLRSGYEVIIGLQLKWQDAPQKAKTKIYDATGTGGHMMLIVGYDKTDANDHYFLIKNSYGDGVIRVHYDIVRNQTNSEIGIIESVRDVNTFHPTRWFGEWYMKHDKWVGKLYIRRAYELTQNRYTGYLRIGEYHHQNGQRYCAYGTWDNLSQKLQMKINFETPINNSWNDVIWDSAQPSVRVLAKDVCAEEAKGQYFELNMSSNVHRHAHGHTIWEGLMFPAEIWR